VVVEGVETSEQLALLKDWGCDLYQGFLGSPPLTHEELTRFAAAS
jgi:EAL domain-containing protein (putative c-di-GMP-specific phosphodiesterase class I)